MYIKPIILSGSVAWAPLISKFSWTKMEAVQNITLRLITGMRYLTRNEVIQESANIRPLSETTGTRNPDIQLQGLNIKIATHPDREKNKTIQNKTVLETYRYRSNVN